MSRWVTYIRERFPLLSYLLVVGGISLSSIAPFVTLQTLSQLWLPLGLAVSCSFLFMVQLRCMDELKDFGKDKIAHPERPLPRGLVGLAEVQFLVRIFNVVLVLCAALLAAVGFPLAGALYFLLWVYLWLMYNEFFVGEWLGERPILYALSHQISLFLMVAYSVALISADSVFTLSTLGLGLQCVGAFLTYEICRKLDPRAHPVLKNYLGVYGAPRTALLVLECQTIALLGGIILEVPLVNGICFALIALCIPLILKDPEKFKLVEALASLVFMVEIFAPGVAALWP